MAEQEGLLAGEQAQHDDEETGSNRFDHLRGTLTSLTREWQERARGRKKSKETLTGQKDDDEDRVAPWRRKLHLALDSTATHAFLLGLLLIDLLATIVDVLHTLHNDSRDLSRCVSMVESCMCAPSFDESESWEFLYWIGIFVLSVLAFNLIGLVIACGLRFFRHPGYVLDAVVVVTALCLEIFLDTETAGLLVILNLWRIVRVAHGVLEVTDEAWEKKINELEVQIQTIETDHREDRDIIDKMQTEIDGLRSRQN